MAKTIDSLRDQDFVYISRMFEQKSFHFLYWRMQLDSFSISIDAQNRLINSI